MLLQLKRYHRRRLFDLRGPSTDSSAQVARSHEARPAKIITVGDLVRMDESQLMQLRSFGKTSLMEVKRKLTEMDLSLGMNIGEAGAGDPHAAASAPVSEL